MGGNQEVEVIASRKVRESEKAVLYLVDRVDSGAAAEVWLPKAKILAVDGQDAVDLEDGEWGATQEAVALTLPYWLARNEGLVE